MNVSNQSINRMNTLETPWWRSAVPRGLAALVLVFESDYEFQHSNDPVENKYLFVFQLSYGF